jgi:hypothetical protein
LDVTAEAFAQPPLQPSLFQPVGNAPHEHASQEVKDFPFHSTAPFDRLAQTSFSDVCDFPQGRVRAPGGVTQTNVASRDRRPRKSGVCASRRHAFHAVGS